MPLSEFVTLLSTLGDKMPSRLFGDFKCFRTGLAVHMCAHCNVSDCPRQRLDDPPHVGEDDTPRLWKGRGREEWRGRGQSVKA